jgi:hypothetical protein
MTQSTWLYPQLVALILTAWYSNNGIKHVSGFSSSFILNRRKTSVIFPHNIDGNRVCRLFALSIEGNASTDSSTPPQFIGLSPIEYKTKIEELTDWENRSSSPSTVVSDNIDHLRQWAVLGQGRSAADLCKKNLKLPSEMSYEDFNAISIASHRLVMYAWHNEGKRLGQSLNPNRSRTVGRQQPKSNLVGRAVKDAARNAEASLQKIEALAGVDGSDFSTVIEDLLQTQQARRGADTLKRWQKQESISQPPLSLYSQVIRTLINTPFEYKGDIIKMGISRAESAADLAHFALNKIGDGSDPFQIMQVNLAVLEAWSKALPTLTQQSKQNIVVLREEAEKVALQAANWFERSAQSGNKKRGYSLLLYTYCKCGKLDQAWDTWKNWMAFVEEKNKDKTLRIDTRSFRMLIQCLAQETSKESTEWLSDDDRILSGTKLAEKACFIVETMWKLHSMGYRDVLPDVFLYTTIVTMYANTGHPAKARNLIQDLASRNKGLQLDSLKPDVTLYNALVNALAKQPLETPDTSVAEEAGSLVKQMERMAQDSGMEAVAPDTVTYNTLIEACLRIGSNDKSAREGIERADQTLTWMFDEYQKGNSRVKPDFLSFATLVRAWAADDSVTDASSTVRSEHWLDRLEERFVPSVNLFEDVILACCRQANNKQVKVSVQKQHAEQAQRLLNRMETLYQAGANSNLRPNRSLYEKVIEALTSCLEGTEAQDVRDRENQMYPEVEKSKKGVESSRFSSDKEVFSVLNDLEVDSPWEEKPIASTRTFNVILKKIASSSKPSAGQRAEDVLYYMLERYLKKGKIEIQPDIITFNSVILAWSKSPHPDSANRAHSIMERLKDLHDKGFLTDVRSDRVSYNTIIHGYARSTQAGAAKRADRVFRELLSLYESTRDEAYRPDIRSYSSLLNAFANAGAAQRAEEILLDMQKSYKGDYNQVCPDTSCFNQVLYAWAKSSEKGAGKRAEMFLRLMEDMSLSGSEAVLADTQSYNIVLHALGSSGDSDAPRRAVMLLERMKKGYEDGKDYLKPDVLSYTTLIAAWCKLGGSQGLEATEQLINEAVSIAGIVVDRDFFSNVLYSLAYCTSNDAARKAEAILAQAKKLNVECDIQVYNALLNCWAKSGDHESSKRSIEILNQLEKDGEADSSLLPNEKTYTIILDTLAKSGDPDSVFLAEAILENMESSNRVKPNVQTYTAMIQNYARSDLPLKSVKALSVLKRMKGQRAQSQPNAITYNAVLNACEHTEAAEVDEAEEAFRVACAIFDEMRALGVKANHVTYGTFLGVIANHMPKSDVRNDLVALVFRRCYTDGQVSLFVTRKLRDASTSLAYKQLLQGNSKDSLPPEWTCNVRERA